MGWGQACLFADWSVVLTAKKPIASLLLTISHTPSFTISKFSFSVNFLLHKKIMDSQSSKKLFSHMRQSSSKIDVGKLKKKHPEVIAKFEAAAALQAKSSLPAGAIWNWPAALLHSLHMVVLGGIAMIFAARIVDLFLIKTLFFFRLGKGALPSELPRQDETGLEWLLRDFFKWSSIGRILYYWSALVGAILVVWMHWSALTQRDFLCAPKLRKRLRMYWVGVGLLVYVLLGRLLKSGISGYKTVVYLLIFLDMARSILTKTPDHSWFALLYKPWWCPPEYVPPPPKTAFRRNWVATVAQGIVFSMACFCAVLYGWATLRIYFGLTSIPLSFAIENAKEETKRRIAMLAYTAAWIAMAVGGAQAISRPTPFALSFAHWISYATFSSCLWYYWTWSPYTLTNTTLYHPNAASTPSELLHGAKEWSPEGFLAWLKTSVTFLGVQVVAVLCAWPSIGGRLFRVFTPLPKQPGLPPRHKKEETQKQPFAEPATNNDNV